MHHDPAAGHHAGVFAFATASAGSGLVWFLEQLSSHGPGWALVPPLLLIAASCAGAYLSWFKMAEDIRQSRERSAADRRREEQRH
jgi:hypothetical protein